MAIMYLSKENFTCQIVQISLYFSVLKGDGNPDDYYVLYERS